MENPEKNAGVGQRVRSFEIPPNQKDQVVLASGGVNPELGESVAESLGIELADVVLKRHPNDELYVRYRDSIRNKQVFIVQSHASANGYRTEEAINEHYYLASAAKDAQAEKVSVIPPYLGHSRGDRKSRGREVVPGPLVIEFFEAVGVHSMMSIDLHSPQTAAHFRGPGAYDHLTAQPELRWAIMEHLGASIRQCVIVSPDEGAMKNNKRHVDEINKILDPEGLQPEKPIGKAIFMDKDRAEDDNTKVDREEEGIDLEGRICLTFDDMIDGGGTMISAAKALKRSGASQVHVGVTHAIFSGDAVENLMASEIDRVFVTDTLPVKKAKDYMGDKLEVVPIGPLIGRAIYETVTNGSISKLFHEQNYG